jgi:hypothetical protein
MINEAGITLKMDIWSMYRGIYVIKKGQALTGRKEELSNKILHTENLYRPINTGLAMKVRFKLLQTVAYDKSHRLHASPVITHY